MLQTSKLALIALGIVIGGSAVAVGIYVQDRETVAVAAPANVPAPSDASQAEKFNAPPGPLAPAKEF